MQTVKRNATPSTLSEEEAARTQLPKDAGSMLDGSGKFPEGLFDSARWWVRQGLDEWNYAQLAILDIMIRSHSLSDAIAEAFTGQVFWLDKAPDSQENMRRLNAYVEYQLLAGKLLGLGIELAGRFNQRPTKPTASAPKTNTEKHDVDAGRPRGREKKKSKRGTDRQPTVN